MALHGVSRSTLDQDLLVTDPGILSADLWQEFNPAASVDVRPGDSDDPLAGVVRIRIDGDRDVDLIVGRHAWQGDILARAAAIPGAPAMRVVRPADLVLLKLYAGGSQDGWDIEQLLALDESGALKTEIESRLSSLPPRCAAMWIRFRRPEDEKPPRS